MPDPDKEGDRPKDQKWQRECETVLEPIGKPLLTTNTLVEKGSRLDRQAVLGIGTGSDLRVGTGVGRAGLVDGAESTCQFTWEITTVPCLGIDFLEAAEMLGERILNGIELFESPLGLFRLTLDQNDGSGKFIGDFIAPAFQFLLAACQFLEALLLFFDLILPLTELEQLGLRPLDLILEFLGGGCLFEIQQLVVFFVEV